MYSGYLPCLQLILVFSKYLADGNIDVRLATENVLEEFLREIKYIAHVQGKQAEAERAKREARQMKRRMRWMESQVRIGRQSSMM